jgi:hypothetical protein
LVIRGLDLKRSLHTTQKVNIYDEPFIVFATEIQNVIPGIEEEARCAAFSITPPGVIEDDMDSYNDTSDQEWLPKPPLILPYKPVFVGPANYDPTTSNSTLVLFYVMQILWIKD